MLEKLSETPVRSVSDVLKSGMPTIGELTRSYGDGVSASVIALEIESLVKFVNVGKTMNAAQQLETARAIVLDFPSLSIADFKLFFQRLKSGVYGKMYDRVDGQIIIEALLRYSDERMEVAGDLTANQHYRAKKEEYNQPYHPDVVTAIRAAYEKAVAKKADKVRVETVKKPDIGQRWIRQFNNLYEKYGTGSGIRLVKIGEKVFDIPSFLNQKALNHEKSIDHEMDKRSK